MTFQEKLTSLFKDKKISNIEIAETTGYSPTMISRYFNKLDPNYKFIHTLNLHYDLDWNYLLKDNMEVNEVELVYNKTPEILLKEIEVRVNKLKEWHNSDTRKK